MGFTDLVPPVIGGFDNLVLFTVQLEPDGPDTFSRFIDDGNADGSPLNIISVIAPYGFKQFSDDDGFRIVFMNQNGTH